MTVITKPIGRLPINKGDWNANYVNPKTGIAGYGKKFRTIRYGCELESKIENNTYDPITWDGADDFTIDTTHWLLVSGNPQNWLAGQDKPAASEQYPYNGMGRIVLKKNDNFKQVIEAQTDGNTIFVIKYDFILTGNVTIPANCILQFDGGSISGNYILEAQNTYIDAGLYAIFNTVDLRGRFVNANFYVEWFGASRSNADNAPAINYAIENLSSMLKGYDVDWATDRISSYNVNLVFSDMYFIKDTIWLRPYVSLIGVSPVSGYNIRANDHLAKCALIADFADHNKYIIDSYLSVNTQKVDIQYNQMYIDTDTIPNYGAYENRKTRVAIKNITLQCSDSEKENGPIFGGIRLTDYYYSQIENVNIHRIQVGMCINNSWCCRFSDMYIGACVCGIYFGKYNTTQMVVNCSINPHDIMESYTGDISNLIFKSGSDIFPSYDINGKDADEEGYTEPIPINNVAVISQSNETDANEILLENCDSMSMDIYAINDGKGKLVFMHCYAEAMSKALLYLTGGDAEWLASGTCYGHDAPYLLAAKSGAIKAEGILYPSCYPSSNGIYLLDWYAYLYDKYTLSNDRKTATDLVAAPNKQYPESKVYNVGYKDTGDGISHFAYITTGLYYNTIFKNIIAQGIKKATLKVDLFPTDMSCGGELIENTDFNFEFVGNTQIYSNALYTTEPIKIKNCNWSFKGMTINQNQPARAIDGINYSSINHNYIFECYGKNKIDFQGNVAQNTPLVKLAGTEPIELEVTFSGSWSGISSVIANLDFGTKYKVTVTNARGTQVFTNPTRPTAGIEIGEVFIENGVPIYYTGDTTGGKSGWVDSTGADVPNPS